MNKFDVIIIGGGLGGLTAAATLVKQGRKVLLLEQHYIPGGCATTFKRKDFIMEVGLHEMDGLFKKDIKQDIFKFLDIDKNVNFIQIPELFRLKGKNIDFVHPHGYEKSLKVLIEKFPNEEKGIRKYLKFMDGVLTEISKFPTDRWKQLLMYPILPLLYPNMVKSSRVSLGKWLDKYIKDEELKLILLTMLLYYHDDPYSMSMTYFSAAQASYIGGGGHFIKGGSQQLSNYLKSVIEQGNGQVILGKMVYEIITRNSKAIGVKYRDNFQQVGSENSVYADSIIANAAIPLVKDLLPKRERTRLGHKIDHLKTACSLLSIYIGFKKEVKALGNKHYSTFILGDNIKTLHDIKQNNYGDWQNKNFVFVDYSQIDAELAPKGKSVGVICAADSIDDWEPLEKEDYAERKEAIAQILFDRLEKEIPGIKDQIEYYEVGTAKTVQRFTLNPEGTAYGFAQTPKQSGMGRVPFKSPIENLYFAGAWTYPGGGFTGAIISGFLCGNKVHSGIPKNQTNNINKIHDERIVKLLNKKEVGENTIEISLEKPCDFHYQAGQFAVVEICDPKTQKIDIAFRSLSFVSHPKEKTLRFAMRLSSSSFKQRIEQAEIGEKFYVYGPMGKFTIPETRDKGIVFLIGGIGITPIMPLIKELQERQYPHPVHLFYSNKRKKTSAYHQELEQIDGLNFNYHPIYTDTQKQIDADLIQSTLKKTSELDYYIVGTGGFIKGMQQHLKSLAVPKEQLKVDDFG